MVTIAARHRDWPVKSIEFCCGDLSAQERSSCTRSWQIIPVSLTTPIPTSPAGLKLRSIAKAIGASERSVRNWIDELRAAKLLKVEVLGWGRPNLYRFQRHPWQNRE
jgi:hypothetical protein